MDIIKELEKEILSLKTHSMKSSTSIATKAFPVQYSCGLRLRQAGDRYRALFDRYLYVTVTSKDNAPLLASLTIEPQDFLGRHVDHERASASPNAVDFRVFVYGNDDDVTRLQNGETISLTYDLNIIATSDCNISTRYVEV